MIYDELLTNALIKIFGNQCLLWDKIKLRNELEKCIYNLHNIMIDEENDKIRNILFKKYKKIKIVDNTFMEHYTNELNKQELNKIKN